MSIQARIPPALCCIHNIIRRYDPEDADSEEEQLEDTEVETGGSSNSAYYGEVATGFITTNERDTMMVERDAIKGGLWEDHVQYVQTHQ